MRLKFTSHNVCSQWKVSANNRGNWTLYTYSSKHVKFSVWDMHKQVSVSGNPFLAQDNTAVPFYSNTDNNLLKWWWMCCNRKDDKLSGMQPSMIKIWSEIEEVMSLRCSHGLLMPKIQSSLASLLLVMYLQRIKHPHQPMLSWKGAWVGVLRCFPIRSFT